MGEHTPPSGEQSRRTVMQTLAAVGAGSTLGAGVVAGRSDPAEGNCEDQLDGHLRRIARKTTRFVEAFRHEATGLVPDRVDETPSGYETSGRTSPANVGVQLLATVSAHELGYLDGGRAVDAIDAVLSTLEAAESWNGLYYRWYDVATGAVHESSPSARNVSTIDNGWLSAGLLVAGQAFPAVRERAHDLVDAADYANLYDPEIYDLFEGETTEPGHMHAYWSEDDGHVGHFGAFNTEPRVAYYVGIGKDDVDAGSWWQMYRTFPPGDDYSWTNQDPSGEVVHYPTENHGELPVYEGHYEFMGETYVPSWGGSMFESLMPSLVMKERELGADALGSNNRRHARLQVAYADAQGYDAWGFSPCATPDGYGVYGVDELGISGYGESGVVTPHATFLALEYVDACDVLDNVRAFRDLDAETEYGFYDSVDVASGERTRAYLVLDQAMVLAPIANYLADGALREYFHATDVGSAPADLLAVEEFTI